jgi:flavin reductase like protein
MPSSHDAPPVALDRPLEVGPDDWRAPGFYQPLTALVVPRPIGWISTISESGVRNVAPYSYFNLMGSDPPYVGFGSTGIKDSLRNLREVPEFVANIVTMHLLERMNFTSGDFPHEETCHRPPAIPGQTGPVGGRATQTHERLGGRRCGCRAESQRWS